MTGQIKMRSQDISLDLTCGDYWYILVTVVSVGQWEELNGVDLKEWEQRAWQAKVLFRCFVIQGYKETGW